MHVLFVHPNFPAQFGHIASHLAARGVSCAFVSEKAGNSAPGVERIQYFPRGGASPHNHYCSRTFENAIWHTHAVYEAVKGRPELRPDLVVAHSGFGSSLFLPELWSCPVINYFEYFYHTKNSDMDFRPDFPTHELSRLRARARNAMLLLDLENCQAGYSPTRWQRSRLPSCYQPKVEVIFDGIETQVWKPTQGPRVVAGQAIPPDTRVVTYVARGMESMRGFDIFMKLAKRLCQERQNVLFFIVGQDRICYGGDEEAIGQKSFKDWVLAQDQYDLDRIRFLGLIPPRELALLLSLTDLHIYLTVPFVLSWSMMNALACGATVLASDTPPVKEMIEHGQNGLLCDFFDIDGMVQQALAVLDDLAQFRPLGQRGIELIKEQYSLDVCLPRMLALYERVINAH